MLDMRVCACKKVGLVLSVRYRANRSLGDYLRGNYCYRKGDDGSEGRTETTRPSGGHVCSLRGVWGLRTFRSSIVWSGGVLAVGGGSRRYSNILSVANYQRTFRANVGCASLGGGCGERPGSCSCFRQEWILVWTCFVQASPRTHWISDAFSSCDSVDDPAAKHTR